MAERNYGRTGASDGASGKYIKVATKDARFVLPDESTAQAFSGYLERIDMEFRDAIPKEELPARWNITLQVSAVVGSDPNPAVYSIGLSSHWTNPILANLVNGVRGAMDDPRWSDPQDRYIRIWLKLVQNVGKRAYCSALGFISEEKGAYLPNKYPWNEGKNQYDGVPSDMNEATMHWLGVAHALVKMTGGSIINQDKATIALPAPISLPNGFQATTPAATAPVPTPTASTTPTVLDRAKKYIEEKADAETYAQVISAAFASLDKYKAEDADKVALAKWATGFLIAKAFVGAGWEVNEQGIVTDSLPF